MGWRCREEVAHTFTGMCKSQAVFPAGRIIQEKMSILCSHESVVPGDGFL